MKTTWVLGAGASREASYPLVSDFLSPDYVDYVLMLAGLSGTSETHIEEVRAAFLQLLPHGIDINALLHDAYATRDALLVRQINNYVLMILRLVRYFHSEYYLTPSLGVLAQILAATDSSVVSFNYDLLIEEQLGLLCHEYHKVHGWRVPPHATYSLGFGGGAMHDIYARAMLIDHGSGYVWNNAPRDGGVRVLKLHGSSAWYFCEHCRECMYGWPAGSDGFFIESIGAASRCPLCGTTAQLRALLVPPASDQHFDAWQLLEGIWSEAEERLVRSDAVVFLGYSLPTADVRAAEMFARVNRRSPQCQYLVVDPQCSSDLRARYLSVLPRANFVPRTLSGFLSLLVDSAKSAPSQPSMPNINEVLRNLISESAVRVPRLWRSMPLGTDIWSIAEDEFAAAHERASALRLLGIAASDDSIERIVALFRRSGNAYVKSQCAQALAASRSQAAVNALAEMITCFEPFCVFDTDGFNRILPRTPAASAAYAARILMLEAPELSYEELLGNAVDMLSAPDDYLLDRANASSMFRAFEDTRVLLMQRKARRLRIEDGKMIAPE